MFRFINTEKETMMKRTGKLNKHTTAVFILLLFSSTVFSQEDEKNVLFEQAGYRFSYQLTKPDKRWELPKKLVEISGLGYVDGHRIACVQDEKGSIYIFNTKKNNTITKIDFGDHGDYEGIEIIGNDAWVLKSNGTLYQIKDYLKDKNPMVKKYKTGLSAKNNAEGLAYDSFSQSLLIACKGYPFVNKNEEKNAREFKAIYRFDLKSQQLEPNPFLLIELDSIKQHKNYNTMALLGMEILAFFDTSEGDVSFQPSAIAIHPSTGNLYVLASVGKSLAVFSKKGKMLSLVRLHSKVHAQPEGICFSPDGTLFIANEGKDGKGVILKFNQKQ